MLAYGRAIEHRGMHADQAGVFDGAGMQYGAMTDGYIAADQQRKSAGGVRSVVCHMQHSAVLHIGTGADADTMHIAARHRERPDRCILAHFDIANHQAGRIDVDARREARHLGFEGSDVHARSVITAGVNVFSASSLSLGSPY